MKIDDRIKHIVDERREKRRRKKRIEKKTLQGNGKKVQNKRRETKKSKKSLSSSLEKVSIFFSIIPTVEYYLNYPTLVGFTPFTIIYSDPNPLTQSLFQPPTHSFFLYSSREKFALPAAFALTKMPEKDMYV